MECKKCGQKSKTQLIKATVYTGMSTDEYPSLVSSQEYVINKEGLHSFICVKCIADKRFSYIVIFLISFIACIISVFTGYYYNYDYIYFISVALALYDISLLRYIMSSSDFLADELLLKIMSKEIKGTDYKLFTRASLRNVI